MPFLISALYIFHQLPWIQMSQIITELIQKLQQFKRLPMILNKNLDNKLQRSLESTISSHHWVIAILSNSISNIRWLHSLTIHMAIGTLHCHPLSYITLKTLSIKLILWEWFRCKVLSSSKTSNYSIFKIHRGPLMLNSMTQLMHPSN